MRRRVPGSSAGSATSLGHPAALRAAEPALQVVFPDGGDGRDIRRLPRHSARVPDPSPVGDGDGKRTPPR